MTLYSPNQEPEEQKTGSIYLINPSVQEFKTQYLDDKNKPVEVMLAPLESRAFPTAVGNIVLNHLVNFILNQAGFSYKTDVKEELEKIRAKCIIYE